MIEDSGLAESHLTPRRFRADPPAHRATHLAPDLIAGPTDGARVR
jgi:hypothetical protein